MSSKENELVAVLTLADLADRFISHHAVLSTLLLFYCISVIRRHCFELLQNKRQLFNIVSPKNSVQNHLLLTITSKFIDNGNIPT